MFILLVEGSLLIRLLYSRLLCFRGEITQGVEKVYGGTVSSDWKGSLLINRGHL